MFRLRKIALPLLALLLIPPLLAGCGNVIKTPARAAYDKGDFNSAVAYFSEAIEWNPNDSAAYLGRGLAYSAKGDYDQAIVDYTEVIRQDPKNATAYSNRGFAYYRKEDCDLAIKDYDEAIRLNPDISEPFWNRGTCYLRKGYYAGAIADFTEVIRMTPRVFSIRENFFGWLLEFPSETKSGAYANRGRAYAFKGDYKSAIDDLTAAINFDQYNAIAYSNRGDSYRVSGEHARAASDYQIAVREFRERVMAHPDKVDALNNAAWMLATCPDPQFRDGAQALDYAKRAGSHASQKNANQLDTMAAAYAESGDFDQAIKAEQEAISLVKGKYPEYRKRLALYQNRKPYRSDMI